MNDEKNNLRHHEPGHVLQLEHEGATIRVLHKVIRAVVKVLAIPMVFVIVWGAGDVLFVLFQRLTEPPFLLLHISHILATFGSFLAVLIAIEIFINISMYLSTNVMPVRLVVATALMAISRKVIIFDFEKVTPRTYLCDRYGGSGSGYNLLADNKKPCRAHSGVTGV